MFVKKARVHWVRTRKYSFSVVREKSYSRRRPSVLKKKKIRFYDFHRNYNIRDTRHFDVLVFTIDVTQCAIRVEGVMRCGVKAIRFDVRFLRTQFVALFNSGTVSDVNGIGLSVA